MLPFSITVGWQNAPALIMTQAAGDDGIFNGFGVFGDYNTSGGG